MNDVFFSNVGKTALKIFGSGLVVLLIGVTSQTTLAGAIAWATAGIFALVGAVLAAIVTLLPQFSWQTYFPGFGGQIADAFTQAALATFLTALAGWFAAPDFSTWHSVLLGAVVGAVNAGARALQAWLTKGETPKRGLGIVPPEREHAVIL